MPIEDLPTIGISAARNGGYTRFVLPGSGSSGQEGFVIYFPDEPPPAATNPAVVSLNPGNEEVYGTTTFQGVNALNLTEPPFGDQAGFTEYFGFSSLNINGPFTVEWFFRSASSLPDDVDIGAIVYSNVEVVATDEYIENEEGAGLFVGNYVSVSLYYDPLNTLFPTLPPIAILVADGYNGVLGEYLSITEPGSTAVTQFKHAAIQHTGEGNFIVHYDGSKIAELSTALESLSVVAFSCAISQVDGVAISQIKVSTSAIYGNADTITVPTTAFYTPPES